MTGAVLRRHLTGGGAIGHLVAEQRDLRIEEADFERTTAPAAIALDHRGQDGDGAVEAAGGVAQVKRNVRRPGLRMPGQAHAAAERLHDEVVAGAPGQRPVGAEGADRDADDARIDVRERRVAQAQTIHHAGAVVVVHHVGGLDQVEKNPASGGRLEIDAHALLVAVVALELRALAFDLRTHAVVANRVALERLDLDHLGAEVGQDHRPERAGDEQRQVENGQAGEQRRERSAHVQPQMRAALAHSTLSSASGRRSSARISATGCT